MAVTNFEFYKEQIKTVGYKFAPLENGKTVDCDMQSREHDCLMCKFVLFDDCSKERIRWLYQEHKETPKLTVNERKLCEILNGGYLVRDRSKRLTVYGKKPRKTESWWTVESDNCWKVDIIFDRFKDCDFSFIKWEDEEPWAVSDLLKLEVAECL